MRGNVGQCGAMRGNARQCGAMRVSKLRLVPKIPAVKFEQSKKTSILARIPRLFSRAMMNPAVEG